MEPKGSHRSAMQGLPLRAQSLKSCRACAHQQLSHPEPQPQPARATGTGAQRDAHTWRWTPRTTHAHMNACRTSALRLMPHAQEQARTIGNRRPCRALRCRCAQGATATLPASCPGGISSAPYARTMLHPRHAMRFCWCLLVLARAGEACRFQPLPAPAHSSRYSRKGGPSPKRPSTASSFPAACQRAQSQWQVPCVSGLNPAM